MALRMDISLGVAPRIADRKSHVLTIHQLQLMRDRKLRCDWTKLAPQLVSESSKPYSTNLSRYAFSQIIFISIILHLTFSFFIALTVFLHADFLVITFYYRTGNTQLKLN